MASFMEAHGGSKGEVGCLFDEIENLVEPTERPPRGEPRAGERQYRDVLAGPLAKQECGATRGGPGSLATDGVGPPISPGSLGNKPVAWTPFLSPRRA